MEHFTYGKLSKFASELFENDKPTLEIVRHFCESLRKKVKCEIIRISVTVAYPQTH